MIDMEKIGVKIEPIYDRVEGSSRTDTSKIHKLRTWLYWKNQDYPFNFIGNGEKTISENLGISKEEALKLLASKLKELLPSIEDTVLRNAVEKRINDYTPSKDRTYECRRCGEPFKKTNLALKNCPKCKIWYSKHGKYAQQSQPQQGITESEKKLLEKLREND